LTQSAARICAPTDGSVPAGIVSVRAANHTELWTISAPGSAARICAANAATACAQRASVSSPAAVTGAAGAPLPWLMERLRLTSSIHSPR
jgi:hypothetical protein